jgi:hypothetical protein
MKRVGILFLLMFVLSTAVFAQVITITMTGTTTGTLTCSEAGLSSVSCWFKATTPIGNGTYSGQVSVMQSRDNRPAIIIFNGPDYVAPDGTRRPSSINLSSTRGIFIHLGDNVSWSDNCVVIAPANMTKLYDTLRANYRLNGNTFSIRVIDRR